MAVIEWALLRAKVGALRSVPLPFLGYSLIRVWISLSYANPALPAAVEGEDLQLLFDLVFVGASVAMALAARRLTPLNGKPAALAVGSVAMGAAVVLQWLSAFVLVSPVLAIVAAVLAGVGTAIAMMVWMELFCCLNPMRTVIYLLLGTVVGVLLTFLIEGFREGYLTGVLAVCPAVSMLMARNSYRSLDAADEPSPNPRILTPWRVYIVMALYELINGLYLGGFADASRVLVGNHSTIATLLASLALFVVAYLASDRFDFTQLYHSPMIIMVCGIVFVPLFGTHAGVVGVFVVSVSSTAFGLLVTLFLCDISKRLNISAIWLFGLQEVGFFFRDAGMLVGEGVHDAAMFGAYTESVLSVVGVVLVVVFTLLLLPRKEVSVRWGMEIFHALGEKVSSAGEEAEAVRVDRACDELASLRNLSPREAEVLKLLAQGKSLAIVANELFIAKGTAKAHTRHIYEKVGVNSRQELFDVLKINPR